MAVVRVRQKNQITLPSAIVEQADLHPDDILEAHYSNGVIMLIPGKRAVARDSIMAYAGIAAGSYGQSVEQIDKTIANLREEWDR